MVLIESGSRHRRIVASLRPATAVAGLAAAELAALRATRDAWHGVRAPGPASLDEAVVLVVVAACALLGGWLVLSTAVACAAHLPGRLGSPARRCARAVVPAATRRVAAILVGAAVGASLAPGTASGAPSTTPTMTTTMTTTPTPITSTITTSNLTAAGTGRVGAPGRAGPSTGPSPGPSPGFAPTHLVAATSASTTEAVRDASVPGPGWTPSRPVHPSAAVARLVTGGTAPGSGEVVVHRGDSLWTIARRHLGPDATDSEVAAAWPHWYAANRDVIGPDPGRLRPGQVLRAPVGAHP